MIPTVHLDECPEPAAYWPNEWVVVLYTAVRERIAPTPGGAWELGRAAFVLGFYSSRSPSDSYRMF